MRLNRSLFAQIRIDDTRRATRYCDLRVDVASLDKKDVLFSVGGRWDRKRKRYVGESPAAKVFTLHPGQLAAARWFADWLRLYLVGKVPEEHGRKMRSLLCAGGRRAGKTDFAVKAAIAFAIMQPKARVWIVSPTQVETEEI